MGKLASVFQGEVTGINQATNYLLTLPSQSHYTFYVDSQAALKSLVKPSCLSHTVWNCRMALDKLTEKGPVILRWIKAHNNHALNELADKLAKKGTTSDYNVKTNTPMALIKRDICKNTLTQWRKRWEKTSSCRQSRLMFPTPNLTFSNFIFTLNRQDLSLIVQFASGHNYLKYHMFNTGRAQDNLCRLCQSNPETAWHLLTECPYLT